MVKDMLKTLAILSLSLLLMAPDKIDKEQPVPITPTPQKVETVKDVMDVSKLTVYLDSKPKVASSITVEEPAYTLTEEEINLIALVTMAEAEGESEYGKRLVIDTILNRVDHDWSGWPDTVKGVIYQKHQFTSMWNGRVNRCYVRDDIVQLVREELKNRTNTEVVFFMMGGYSKYGTPEFKEGVHYFSSY